MDMSTAPGAPERDGEQNIPRQRGSIERTERRIRASFSAPNFRESSVGLEQDDSAHLSPRLAADSSASASREASPKSRRVAPDSAAFAAVEARIAASISGLEESVSNAGHAQETGKRGIGNRRDIGFLIPPIWRTFWDLLVYPVTIKEGASTALHLEPTSHIAPRAAMLGTEGAICHV
ncbi:hypothetical protein M8818_000885 [Zalaria obscura]|uniref:Uncharacterized protein n=1 Tax=Zalaria obscura TaxID=2024903 RepID=A0ACC3SN25_9PEZI